VRNVLRPGGVFVLEFANKLNLKAVLRYLLRRQEWSPFTLEPVEFVRLNFDFHPRAVRAWLQGLGFTIEKTLTLSHFRIGLLKRLVPTGVLVFADSLFQWTGALWQLSPSVFVKARCGVAETGSIPAPANVLSFFKCPDCGRSPLSDERNFLQCPNCKEKWEVKDGIYDFRKPLERD